MLIQFILIVIIAVIILRLIYQLKNKDIGLSQFLSWLFIWLLALIIIWYPQVTTFLAIQVGIGRGVDLAVYVSIILVFYLIFRLWLKIGQIEKQITQIVRAEALKNIIDDEEK